MMDALTLDQIQIFLAVVEHGGFSAAARAQGRATSAITYAVQKMETQIEVPLFDRSRYRPVLTDAGKALLPRARRIVEETNGLRIVARSLSGGLEAEVPIAVDSMFPMDLLLGPFRAFQSKFPGVQLRILVENLGGTSKLVLDRVCVFGLALQFAAQGLDLVSASLVDVPMLMVAAPAHPLGQVAGPIELALLQSHIQLVLTDRSEVTGARDHSVYSGQTWRLSDLGAKHEMLRAGLGFGSLPAHMIKNDLAAGRLVVLNLAGREGKDPILRMVLVRQSSLPMGPATRWLVDTLATRGLCGPVRPGWPAGQTAPQKTLPGFNAGALDAPEAQVQTPAVRAVALPPPSIAAG